LFINPAKFDLVYRCQSFIPWYHVYYRNSAKTTVSITIYITWYIMWYVMWHITWYISMWYCYTYDWSSTPPNLVLCIVVNHSYHGTMIILETARKRRCWLQYISHDISCDISCNILHGVSPYDTAIRMIVHQPRQIWPCVSLSIIHIMTITDIARKRRCQLLLMVHIYLSAILVYITWCIMWYIVWYITWYISIWYSYTYDCSSTPPNLVLCIVFKRSHHDYCRYSV